MNKNAPDQEVSASSRKELIATTKVQRKIRTSIPEGSILKRLMAFAFSIPDFRRTGKGNIRHVPADVILLMTWPECQNAWDVQT